MKTTFKAIVLAASLSMIAGSAFALDTDLEALTVPGTVVEASGVADAFAALQAVAAPEDSVAAVVQFSEGNVNFAFIDQTSTDIGNVAVIAQDSTTVANSAAIVQVGTLNRAYINQH